MSGGIPVVLLTGARHAMTGCRDPLRVKLLERPKLRLMPDRVWATMPYSGAVQTVSVSEAKDRLSQLVEAVETTHDAVTITRHGRAAAVLIAAADLQQLTDTVEWLNDPLTAPEVAEAEADIATGRTMSVDEARAALRRGRR